MSQLQINETPISALTPYERNARTHSKKQIQQIACSIEQFGFTNPVLVDTDNHIIAGHGRVEAAKSLGVAAVPTICLDHLTEAEKRAYIIADNRLAELAGWDKEILAIEFQHLTAMDIDIQVTMDSHGTRLINPIDVPFPSVTLNINAEVEGPHEGAVKVSETLREYCAVSKMLQESGTEVIENWTLNGVAV